MVFNSNILKTALLSYFRSKGEICATEYSYELGIADIISLNKKGTTLTEVEIKVNKYDLLNEISNKEKKHISLKEGTLYNNKLPNKFYYCVPKELVNDAKIICNKLNSKYGIILFEKTKYPFQSFSIIKKAQRLHNTEIDKQFHTYYIGLRNCNKVCTMHEDKYWN